MRAIPPFAISPLGVSNPYPYQRVRICAACGAEAFGIPKRWQKTEVRCAACWRFESACRSARLAWDAALRDFDELNESRDTNAEMVQVMAAGPLKHLQRCIGYALQASFLSTNQVSAQAWLQFAKRAMKWACSLQQQLSEMLEAVPDAPFEVVNNRRHLTLLENREPPP